MSKNDYFSESAITQRLNRRHRRYVLVSAHFFIGFCLIAIITSRSISIYDMLSDFSPQLATEWANVWHRLPGITPVHFGLLMFGLFVLHAIWASLRTYAENEIDVQMREARYYKSRRYDSDPDTTFRLGDDGELFYDAEEIEYELKPKRKSKR
jgi:hypothetical protein